MQSFYIVTFSVNNETFSSCKVGLLPFIKRRKDTTVFTN